jgi:hypothetical protein
MRIDAANTAADGPYLGCGWIEDHLELASWNLAHFCCYGLG